MVQAGGLATRGRQRLGQREQDREQQDSARGSEDDEDRPPGRDG